VRAASLTEDLLEVARLDAEVARPDLELGLTIALGQAQVIGAEVFLRNGESGGAAATVRLPVAD
jgi:hypothetical protein